MGPEVIVKTGFPTRPLFSNTPYNVKVVHVVDPGDFYLRINDSVGKDLEASVQKGLTKFDATSATPVVKGKLFAKMPVVILSKDVEGGKKTRGEVVCGNPMAVCVNLIDLGKKVCVPYSAVFAANLELIRLPKLTLRCAISQIQPPTNGWREENYEEALFQYKKSLIARMVKEQNGTMLVYIERDGIDLGLELTLFKSWADMTPLSISKYSDERVGKYPLNDFTPWIGCKIACFGTAIKRPQTPNGFLTCFLQLDPAATHKVLHMLANISNKTLTKFLHASIGDAVIVLHANEKCRATVMKVGKQKCIVKLVDYGEYVHVNKRTQIFELPDELLNHPEGATPCILSEMIKETPTTYSLVDQVSGMIIDQDLYGCIGYTDFPDASDASNFRKCVLTLERPDENTAQGTPFHKLLPLVEPQYKKNDMIGTPLLINPGVADAWFNHNPTLIYAFNVQTEYRYDASLIHIQSCNTMWLQLEGDRLRADTLTKQITEIYENSKNVPFDASCIVPGAFLMAQQEDKMWYRCQILSMDTEEDTGFCAVLFLDCGLMGTVNVSMLRPMLDFFAKDPPMAVKVEIPVDLAADHTECEVVQYVERFVKGKYISVSFSEEGVHRHGSVFHNTESLVVTLEQLVVELCKNGLTNRKTKEVPIPKDSKDKDKQSTTIIPTYRLVLEY